MDEDAEQLPPNARLPLKFRLGSRLVVAEKAELLDPDRTVYRLELSQPPLLITLIQPVIALCPWVKARWHEWFLPPTVILKKQKVGWEEQFRNERQAYDVLKPIQGTVVPHFYGEAVYDGSPTLVLSCIDGKTLFDVWSDLPEETLRQGLENALGALTSYGVHYTDAKLDNFLMADGGRVMVVDLEEVRGGEAQYHKDLRGK